MCGRFVGFRKLEELEKYFPIDKSAAKTVASYNITPSQEILALIRRNQENMLDLFHWGLVPFWAKDISMGNKMTRNRGIQAKLPHCIQKEAMPDYCGRFL